MQVDQFKLLHFPATFHHRNMDYQLLFNMAVGLAGVFGGWVLNRIYTAIDRLDNDVRAMPEKYVSKEDYRRDIYEIKDICKQIFSKLDTKADKE